MLALGVKAHYKATNLGKKNVFYGGKFCIVLGATFIFNLMF
jgi:hypothetical protein